MSKNKELNLYYSISNGGDGSASLTWFLSKELCELDQYIKNTLRQDWSTSCTGSITIEYDSISTFKGKVQTKEEFIAYLKEEILCYEDTEDIEKHRGAINILLDTINKAKLT